jgi:hypothetical protein
MAVELLHAGCLALAWDGDVLAAGLGRLWRRHPGGWRPEALRPLHAVHHEGATRRVDVLGGYVYVEGSSGWRATATTDGDEVLVHPSGAVAFARHGVVHRAARPGCTPVDVPELREDSVRFGPQGVRLLGLASEGPVQVDLATGDVHALDGVPLGVGVVLQNGRVHQDAEVLATGLIEASPAVGPRHLAGPGGRLWSLDDGTPSPSAPIALGATTAVGDGFATVAFEATEGVRVDATGNVQEHFPVDVEEDDLVVSLEVADGALWAETAWARRLRLLDLPPTTPAAGSDTLGIVVTPLGPLDDALFAERHGRAFAWSEAGWLLTWAVTTD